MDNHTTNIFLKNLKIKYFWIFVTEECNLNCSYCFYRFRDRGRSIELKNIKVLFDVFPNLKYAEFVISGGEPLLEWDLTCKIIDYLKSKFNNYILVQTNGTLLDKPKIKFLKEANIGLELGIDGTLATMLKYRKGIHKYFNRIVDNIENARTNNLRLYSTMTVHPEKASEIFKNYRYLIDIGIEKVEITPAAFERWNQQSVNIFQEEYKRTIKFAIINNKLGTISTEYDRPLKNMFVDLIPLPDNNVMTNWALLALPKTIRNRFSFLQINKRDIRFNKAFLNKYLRAYLWLFNENKGVTYRDYSNLNASWVYERLFGRRQKYMFKYYEDIGNFFKKINQEILLSLKAGYQYDKVRKQ